MTGEKVLDDPRDDPKPNGAPRGRPAGKAKRQRRNYAAEFAALESNVRVALILIRKAASRDTTDVAQGEATTALLETAVELLEQK